MTSKAAKGAAAARRQRTTRGGATATFGAAAVIATSRDAATTIFETAPPTIVADGAHGPTATLARVRAFAALKAARGGSAAYLLVINAAYGLENGALVLEAGGGRRLWAAALGAALRAAGGDWAVVIDGATSLDETRRAALAGAARRDLGAPERGILVVIRAPGDVDALAPRLATPRAIPSEARPLVAAPLAGALAALADRAFRAPGPAAVVSFTEDGAPAAPIAARQRLVAPGLELFGAELRPAGTARPASAHRPLR